MNLHFETPQRSYHGTAPSPTKQRKVQLPVSYGWHRIDEVHTLVGGGQTACGTGAGMDIANLLKPPLARGSLRCIAATTLGELRFRGPHSLT